MFLCTSSSLKVLFQTTPQPTGQKTSIPVEKYDITSTTLFKSLHGITVHRIISTFKDASSDAEAKGEKNADKTKTSN